MDRILISDLINSVPNMLMVTLAYHPFALKLQRQLRSFLVEDKNTLILHRQDNDFWSQGVNRYDINQ